MNEEEYADELEAQRQIEEEGLSSIRNENHVQTLKHLGSENLTTKKLHISCDINDPAPLELVAHVKEVKIVGPKVTRIDYLPIFKRAEILEIQETKIPELNGLNQMPSLNRISLHNNELLEYLGMHLQSSTIKIFNLSGSILREFPAVQFDACEMFSYTCGIINRLDELLPKVIIPKLRFLSLAAHQINKIEALNTYPMLKRIDLSENKITRLEGFDACPELERIDVTWNPISDIHGVLKIPKLKIIEINKDVFSLFPKNFQKRVLLGTSSTRPTIPSYVSVRHS